MVEVNERYNKKWTALMMPEHIGMIQAMVGRMLHGEMPIIDEDKQEDMQADIEYAIRFDLPIRVTYHDGKYIDTVVGGISSLNHQQRRLEMIVPEEYELVYIPYTSIVDTEFM